LNSVRFVMQAIEVEARRQIELIEAGGAVEQQTRLFDSVRGETRPMRSKEHAHDYRYFPDPDLLPLVLDPAWIEELRGRLPELPDAKKARFVAEYGLRPADADVLIADAQAATYFEKVAEGRDPRMAANWVMGDLFARMRKMGLASDQDADEEHVSQWHRLPVRAEQLGRLIDLIADGTISGRIAKDVFDQMMRASGYPDPMQIVEASGLRQVTDTGAIEAAVDAALAAHPAQVAQYHANPKVLGFFVGQVMKATGGKANPALVNELLQKKLGG
jgi:aspartyl-tRNA(Asn)/glutamyl-tRNA(Gln) amidotransferase subunit B